jgi:hypothetical protein
MASNIATRIPQPKVAFVDAAGNVSREWLYFLMAILARTGGDAGVSIVDIQNQIAGLSLDALGDIVPPPPPTFSVDTLLNDAEFPVAVFFDPLSDDASVAAAPNAVILGLSLSDNVPAAPINPFLASLFVMDAA